MSVDELAKERYDLAVERIREIREEKTVAEPYLDFFTKTAGFLEEMICPVSYTHLTLPTTFGV